MSIHRVKSSSFYAAPSMTSWLRLATAAVDKASTAVGRATTTVDEAAAALCRRQWQLARVSVASPEARTFARGDRTPLGRTSGRGCAWH